MHHAQLIFTTHDTNLLNHALMRREQIWFVEKQANGSSELFSLADFSVHKEERFAQNYLEGRYGAVPNLEQFAEGWLSES